MAKCTKEWFECDRCGHAMDKPFYGGEAGTYKAKFYADFAVAGHSIMWDQLCEQCNRYLGDLMSDESIKAKALRAEADQ